MDRIIAQAKKELAQFLRDRLTVALALVLPLLTLLIFGFAIRLEADDIPIVIQDFDNTALSRSYIERLFATNQFEPTQWSGDDPVEDAIKPGLARAAVIIPPDFSSQIKAGKPVDVQVLVDGTDVNNARVIRNSIQATTQFFLRTNNLLPENSLIEPQTRIWFNPGREEALYIVPGTCALILWIYPSLLSSLAMVRETEQNTIVQVYASSLTARELLLGKGLAYLAVGLGITAAIFLLSAIVFGLRLAGDPTPLLVGTLAYVMGAVMFGLFVGTRASNQIAAVQAVATIGFLTALLLSGFIYPLSNIPFPLSLISNVVPARYYIPVIRDAFVRGGGWPGVWIHVGMLIVLGLVIFNGARRNIQAMQLPD
jgi:ABC-2 type transport system permease protein